MKRWHVALKLVCGENMSFVTVAFDFLISICSQLLQTTVNYHDNIDISLFIYLLQKLSKS